MNADELVRTLREDARQSRDVLHICHSVINAEEAADLIESLQAKISRLQAQLAEARRRERAAVESLAEYRFCVDCKHGSPKQQEEKK